MYKLANSVESSQVNHQRRNVIKTPQNYVEVLQQVLANLDFVAIEQIAHVILEATNRQAHILLAGNGGSACNIAHYCCDLTLAFRPYKRCLKLLNLAESSGMITALGNDFDFANIFSYQVQDKGFPGDVFIALSASGNSPNIVAACKAAQNLDMCIVTITGFDGGKIAQMADYNITIPSNNYGVIEDTQLAMGHMISQTIIDMLENSL